uniref:Uncharacterized protein n=1 Tax=Caenorhabditis japonica TaxID=281687 RepID=A0A8R1I177_CAEJA
NDLLLNSALADIKKKDDRINDEEDTDRKSDDEEDEGVASVTWQHPASRRRSMSAPPTCIDEDV